MTEPRLVAGRYLVLGVLGRGGMGEVWLAHDQRLDTKVAIKRVPPELGGSANLKESLLKEARILARLNDPRIVRLFDLADCEDGLLMVLEYVCGPSLQQMLKGHRRITEVELMHLMRDVCGGLEVAHTHGIIHRDLKPGNLLLALPESAQAEFLAANIVPADIVPCRAKVADFGIAKVLESAQTVTAGIAGSPLYMAPEQFRGEAPSVETDVYALGLVAYEMLTGTPPFPQGDPGYHHMLVMPEPIRNCSAHVNAAVLRALAKQRSNRFPSAMAFLDALGRADDATARTRTPPDVPPAVFPPARRPRWIVPVLAALAAAAAINLTGWVVRAARNGLLEPGAAPSPTISLVTEPAPYVSQWPPVVENAPDPQLPAESGDVIGARNPHVIWKAVQSPSPIHLAGIGGDRTTYLNAGSNLWAVRDGRLQWGYSGVEGTCDTEHPCVVGPLHYQYSDNRLHMGLDGRVWLASGFAFNRDGRGGRLKGPFYPPRALEMQPFEAYLTRVKPLESYLPPETSPHGFTCVRGVENSDWHAEGPGLEGHDDQGKRWFVPLDHDCYSVQTTRNGDLYATTATKNLYRIDLSGRIRWTYRALCTNPALRSLPAGDVIVVCVEEPLQCVRDGRLLWTFTGGRIRPDIHGHSEFPGVEVDQAGTTYFSDWALEKSAQFYAVDSQGRLKWKLKLGDIHVDELQFDKAGKIYVSGDGFDGADRGSNMICLSD